MPETLYLIAAESETAKSELRALTAGVEYEGVRLVARGDAWTVVLDALELLTMGQIHALRVDVLPPLHRRVAAREVAAARERLAADRAATATVADCAVGPFLMPLDDEDDDADTVLEPVDPLAGVREAYKEWAEDGRGEAS